MDRSLPDGGVTDQASDLIGLVGDQNIRFDSADRFSDGLDLVLSEEGVIVLEAQIADIVESENPASLASLLELLRNSLFDAFLDIKLGARNTALFLQLTVMRSHSRCGEHGRHPVAASRVVRKRAAGLVKAVRRVGSHKHQMNWTTGHLGFLLVGVVESLPPEDSAWKLRPSVDCGSLR